MHPNTKTLPKKFKDNEKIGYLFANEQLQSFVFLCPQAKYVRPDNIPID